jgi:GntR family transcriptional regulator
MAQQEPATNELDRSGEVPLYAQIVRILQTDIQERQLAPGTVLPSEAVLCKRFGVARSVIRQALAVLVSEGVIHREQGRAPVVAARRPELRRMVQRSTGLYDQFASAGTLLRTRILRLEVARPPSAVAAFLGTDDTWLLERLRGVEATPLAFVRTWLPRARMPGLTAEALTDASLHRVLGQQYGMHPGAGRNRIRAVVADPSLADTLTVLPGSPLLMLEGQGLDEQGQPMEWFTTWHRAEHLVFDVEVGPSGEQIQAVVPPAERIGRPNAPGTSGATPMSFAGGGRSAPLGPLDVMEQKLTDALDTLRRLRNPG